MGKYLVTLGDGTVTEMDAAKVEEAPAPPAIPENPIPQDRPGWATPQSVLGQIAAEKERIGSPSIREVVDFSDRREYRFEDATSVVIVVAKDGIDPGKQMLVYGPVETPTDPGGQGDRV